MKSFRDPQPSSTFNPLFLLLPLLLITLLGLGACAPAQPANTTVQVQPTEQPLDALPEATNLVVVNQATGISEILLSETNAANNMVYALQNLSSATLAADDVFAFTYEDGGEREFLVRLLSSEEILLEQTVTLDLSSRQYLIIAEAAGQYSLLIEQDGGELLQGMTGGAADAAQLAAELYEALQQAESGDADARAELFSLLPQVSGWEEFQALGSEGSDPLNELTGWLWQQRESLSSSELTAAIELAGSGIDGAYSEGLQALYYDCFIADNAGFLTAMAQADPAAQQIAAERLAAELYYYAAEPWEGQLNGLDEQQAAALELIEAQRDYWLERRAEDSAGQ